MTADTITAIKKALEKVYIGEWYISGVKTNGLSVVHNAADSSMFGITAETFEAEYVVAANPFAISELISTLESLQRENEALKKDRYDLAYAITGGEDAPGLLDSVPTSQLVDIAGNTHRSHSADIERAMAAEAEVKRLREKLEPFSRFAGVLFERNFNRADSVSGMDDVDGVLHTISAGPFFDARAALSSTGDTHGN